MGTVESWPELLIEHLGKGHGQLWEHRWRQSPLWPEGVEPGCTTLRPHLRADCHWARISFWRSLPSDALPCKPRIFWYRWAIFFPSFIAPLYSASPFIITFVVAPFPLYWSVPLLCQVQNSFKLENFALDKPEVDSHIVENRIVFLICTLSFPRTAKIKWLPKSQLGLIL